MFGFSLKKTYFVHDKNHTIHADFKAWNMEHALKIAYMMDLGEDFDWDGAYITRKGYER